jgi:hypothetical protein
MGKVSAFYPGSADYRLANEFAEKQYRFFGILAEGGRFREMPNLYLVNREADRIVGVMGIFLNTLPLTACFNLSRHEAMMEVGRVAFEKTTPKRTMKIFQELIQEALTIRNSLDCQVLIETHGSMCRLASRALRAIDQFLCLEKVDAEMDLESIPDSGRSFFEEWRPAVYQLFGTRCDLTSAA